MFNRQIFGPIFNGQKPVFVDPLVAYRKLNYALDGIPNDYISDSKSEDVQISYPAKEKIVEATRFAFGLQPFNPDDGQGTQDEDCWLIFNTFLKWVEEKKVRAES
jgi:hypothetical protein